MIELVLDPRSLLQIWRQSGHNLRLQYREFQAVKIRSRRAYGNGKSKAITIGTAWRIAR